MDQIISWETAKLAKEKGFNIPVSRYYRDEKLIVNFEDSGCNEESYYFDADSLNENWNDGRVVNKDNNSCWGCTKGSYLTVNSAPNQSYRNNPNRKIRTTNKQTWKRVIQICSKTLQEIEVYESVTEASKKTNLFKSGISACAKGKLKTCGGYIWKYQ